MQAKPSLEDTLALMRDLRARCDWDAAQTHESLRPYLIEEAYEVDDAIRSGDDAKLREELGDLLLQVLFHSVVAEERGAFSMYDVAEGFITKMKGRHPHLYGDGAKQSWEAHEGEAARRASSTGCRPTFPRCTARFGCRIARRASASTGPTSKGRSKRSRKSWMKFATKFARRGAARTSGSRTRSATCCSRS